MSKFFSLLLLVSSAFIAEAAKIVFYNKTGQVLTIMISGEEIAAPVDKICRALAKKRYFETESISTLTFQFKIGDGEFKSYTLKHFINPHTRIDTEKAISGDFTRNIYIEGYDNDYIEEQIVEDEAGLIQSQKNSILQFAGSFVKGRLGSYWTMKDGEKIDIPMKDALVGTSKNLSEDNTTENIHIRKLISEQLACDDEIMAVMEREKRVRKFQKDFLGEDFSDDEATLSIGIAGSGGGVRARISTTGFVKGAIDSGLFDCVTYFSALSGSSWMLAPWIFRKDKNIDKFIDVVVKNSTGEIENSRDNMYSFTGLPQIDFTEVKSNFLRQKAWNRHHGLVNMFGIVLQKTFLKEVIDETKNKYGELYLSSMRNQFEGGLTVIPIFEVRAEKKEENAIIIQEPCFFTPWEFGSRFFGQYGACVNIKTFGSKFENNKALPYEISNNIRLQTESVKRIGPEPELGLIMATCGSAFTVQTSTVSNGIAQQNIDPIYKLRHSIFNNSFMNCEFNNFMHTDNYFTGFYNKPTLYLHDAGIVANIPVISLYRKPVDAAHGIKENSAPDIIIIFDASDTSSGTIGEELLMNKKEMAKKGLPFPEINEVSNTDPVTKIVKKQLNPEIIREIRDNGGFYIFDKNPDKEKYKNWEIPTIVYMTLVPGVKYKDKNREEFTFDFNNFGTFKFKYDEDTCKNLIGMNANILEKNKARIKLAMKKRKVLNMERAFFALENIKNSSKRQDEISQDIKVKSKVENNLKDECENLNVEINALVNESNNLDGLPEKKKQRDENRVKIIQKRTQFKKMQLLKKQVKNSVKKNKSAIKKTKSKSIMLELEKEMLEAKLRISESDLEILRSDLTIRKAECRWCKLKLKFNKPELKWRELRAYPKINLK
ncbi:MAG: hypothetical protein UR12_C0030G0013 [candidate division TM6 bacterium GW2011_GWF2_30_66]|nr:MAG: hypothetical protein UR12_C0030G0013 [candidate division TM6 bacterium GW2011_GWF2_30_66]